MLLVREFEKPTICDEKNIWPFDWLSIDVQMVAANNIDYLLVNRYNKFSDEPCIRFMENRYHKKYILIPYNQCFVCDGPLVFTAKVRFMQDGNRYCIKKEYSLPHGLPLDDCLCNITLPADVKIMQYFVECRRKKWILFSCGGFQNDSTLSILPRELIILIVKLYTIVRTVQCFDCD